MAVNLQQEKQALEDEEGGHVSPRELCDYKTTMDENQGQVVNRIKLDF